MNTAKLKQLLKAAGALYVEILGGMFCTSWATSALADKCEATMRRAGIREIERGLNGDETAFVCTGWL